MTEFCNENNIVHELASAYNPKSNGLAEAAVKNVKLLMKKWRMFGYSFVRMEEHSEGRHV